MAAHPAPSPPPSSPAGSYAEFIRRRAKRLRELDPPARTRAEWLARRAEIHRRIGHSLGQSPDPPCPLEPKLLSSMDRVGYRIERLLIQSRPDLWITANAYVPTRSAGAKHPAVLCVHGHWPGARMDPHVQAHCLGLVQLGFFVLAVDAFGAGERAIRPARGEYHGARLGASLWPAGTPLLGLQVSDNHRAIDYLLTRPEVDGTRLAITGASGGGNQTMYAGALDERFAAVIPVCSVGTFQAYLTTAECVCENLLDGLAISAEGELLGLMAPRALMVISASRDAFQFSVGEAAKSIALARRIFDWMGAGDHIRHVAIESGHDYNQPMRQAMYGWVTRFLKGEGDGRPVPEPPIQIEDMATLHCFPEGGRPKTYVTIPAFVRRENQRRVAAIALPDHPQQWQAQANLMRHDLWNSVLANSMPVSLLDLQLLIENKSEIANRKLKTASAPGAFSLAVQPDLHVPVIWKTARRQAIERPGPGGPTPGTGASKARPRPAISPSIATVMVLDPRGKEAVQQEPLVQSLLAAGADLAIPDLPGADAMAGPSAALGDVPDHNTVEWAHWIGWPLMAQWAATARQLITRFSTLGPEAAPRRMALLGFDAAGLAAVCAAASDARVAAVATVGSLASFLSDAAPAGVRMAHFVPNLLAVGDVPHLAALVAPRPLLVASPIDVQARPLPAARLDSAFAFTRAVYKLLAAGDQFSLAPVASPERVARVLMGA